MHWARDLLVEGVMREDFLRDAAGGNGTLRDCCTATAYKRIGRGHGRRRRWTLLL